MWTLWHFKSPNESARGRGIAPEFQPENSAVFGEDSISPPPPPQTAVYQFELASAVRLKVLDPNTLRLSKEATVLFRFSPEKLNAINNSLETFTRKLFAEELSRAYVEVSQESGEVIVVPSFNRRPLYDELKAVISQLTERSVAGTMLDRISHDIRLGCVTSEIRVSFDDVPNGSPLINFTRTVLTEGSRDPDIPLNSPGSKTTPFDTTIKMKTRAPSGRASDPRLRHLVEAAAHLPKRNK